MCRVTNIKQKSGEWVKPHWRNSVSCAVCSRCGFKAYHYDFRGVQENYRFCPHCGVPMKRAKVVQIAVLSPKIKVSW